MHVHTQQQHHQDLRTGTKTTHSSSSSSSSLPLFLTIAILATTFACAFASRLFSVIRFESVIHEFDPWFNYRATRYLVEHGWYEFLNWFDETSWYPLGRVVGGTVYPGIMVTAAIGHKLLDMVNLHVDIRNICVFLAPFFSGWTAIATYLLTAEIKDTGAGLLSAIFIGIAPGYISRSVAGSYDNEGIAIFLLQLSFYLWIKAIKLGSASWAVLASLSYFYMVSAWGGYAFIINLVPLHVLGLILMGRYSSKIYISYSTFYVLGTMLSMQIPFVGFQPTRTSEHMGALAVFGLVQLVAFYTFLQGLLTKNQLRTLQTIIVTSGIALSGIFLLVLTSGVVAPWTGRFYSLWDTEYAKKYIPIIASVSEHQPTAWPSYFFDLHCLIFLFPAGLFASFCKLRDEHVFLIVYGVFASYFSGVMVRLMLTLTPVVCITAAIAVSEVLDIFLKMPETAKGLLVKPEAGKITAAKVVNTAKHVAAGPTRFLVIGAFLWTMFQFVWHCTWVTSSAYSSPSIVLASRNWDGSQAIIDDFREAYYWLRKNTKKDAKIASWWDYGYQTAGMADRYTLVDNNTWNNTHIATVGRIMASNEQDALPILKQHNVDYLLVIFGGVIGYSGDDINKFLWMIRIGQGVYPKHVREENFFSASGEYKVDKDASKTMKDSLMYKMSYYRFKDLHTQGPAQDRVRDVTIPDTDITLDTLEEVYSSEHYIVRLYKVKDDDNFGRTLHGASTYERGRRHKPKA